MLDKPKGRSMKEYVDVEVLKQQDFQDFSNTDVMHAIDNCPRADVEPVRHGKWIMDKKWGTAICSECKFEIEDDYFWRAGDFRPWEGCPICRSKMDGEVEE